MEPISLTIISGLIVTIIGGAIVAWFRRRWEINDLRIKIKEEEREKLYAEIKKLQEQHKKQGKYLWRIGKTVVIMSKIIDDQTEKLHPELSSSLEDIAQELLNESPND